MTGRRVTGIVVNYRTPDLTTRAVDSLLADGVDDVVIVENGSGDGSAATLGTFVAGRPTVTLVVSGENVGFGRGVNLGAASASGDHLFLLNSDAEVEPGATATLGALLDAEPAVAIAAPLVVDRAGHPQLDAYGVLPTWQALVRRTNRRPPDTDRPEWVSGVAMLVRRTAFDALGGFDPHFFMYFEDVDLCRRLRATGHGIRRVTHAVVRHEHQGSRASSRSFLAQYYAAQDEYVRIAGWPRAQRVALRVARAPIRVYRRLVRS